MPVHLTLGGDDDWSDGAHELELPLLADLEGVALAHDALDHATAERVGVVVAGPKGVGKSAGVAYAVDRHLTADRARAAADAGYRPRRLLQVRTIRGASYRDVLLFLLREVVDPGYRDRVHGRAKTVDEVRGDLAELALSAGAAALVVEEAETLTDVAIDALRDLLAETEARDPSRLGAAGFEGGGRKPAGLGVLLVGTEASATRLTQHEEGQHRFARVVRVPPLTEAQAAAVYRAWLPRFAAHPARGAPDPWAAYTRDVVTQGRRLPIRRVERHVRLYARRLGHLDPTVRRREAVYLLEELFEFTWRELDRLGGDES